MEIQQLRHLMAAVEHRNLLKAAEHTFISQSGLSRSIRSLEHRLGVPLLIRGPKGVEPTVYGLSVLRRAKVILNEVAKSIEEVRAIEQARVGEVTFGITPNYATYLVPQLLAELHRDRPSLKVTVITDGFVELIERVKTESIDFAFGLIGQGPPQRRDRDRSDPGAPGAGHGGGLAPARAARQRHPRRPRRSRMGDAPRRRRSAQLRLVFRNPRAAGSSASPALQLDLFDPAYG